MLMVPEGRKPFGTRRFGAKRVRPDGTIRTHNGVDVFAPMGSPVLSPVDAVVRIARTKWSDGFSGYGRIVVLHLEDGREMLIAHLDEVRVRPGQLVERGDIVGTVGRTAFPRNDRKAMFRTSQPHTHIELLRGTYPTSPKRPRLDPTALIWPEKKDDPPPDEGGKDDLESHGQKCRCRRCCCA